uniref:Uncharacterized protein n=1 Tax=Arundo donax TaxID=35708 RepID=A0A0A8YW59_ARUDO
MCFNQLFDYGHHTLRFQIYMSLKNACRGSFRNLVTNIHKNLKFAYKNGIRIFFMKTLSNSYTFNNQCLIIMVKRMHEDTTSMYKMKAIGKDGVLLTPFQNTCYC